MKFIRTDMREKKALKQAFLRFMPIPVALILLVSILISYRDYIIRKEDVIRTQQSQLVTAMIGYRNDISDLTSIARSIVTDYLDLADDPALASSAEALFQDNIRQYPGIDKLRILNTDGMETLCVVQRDGAPYTVPADELRDQSNRDFYIETALLGRHQFLFSRVDLCMENGEIKIDPQTGLTKPILRISTPLELDGRRIGYFIASFLMREYLNQIRTSLSSEGCEILLMDENGYLYNDADDSNNFGYCYPQGQPQHNRSIRDLYPNIDLQAGGGSFIAGDQFCTYAAYGNIYDRSKDFYLSEAASAKLIFLIRYNSRSPYAQGLRYAYFYNLIRSWPLQLLTWSGLILLYALVLRLIFLYDRLRFTNLFSDNRYPKSMLKQAINRNQFVNYYQPILNIQDGTVLGVEALSRWIDRGQVLQPSMFMDEILHYQLGQMLDEHVFLSVREDYKRLRDCPGFEKAFISINCGQQTFDSLIQEPPSTKIQLTEEEKKYIVLELVENIIFNRDTQDRIRELYKHNILFAIDDFGTGYSNVAFIRSFENLKVKIDRTFVPVDTTNHKERIIIEAFVKMFIDQGLKLIVEGVETKEQIQYLRNLGVSGVQGFYFSHPMTIDQLVEYLQKQEYLHAL